MLSKPFLTASDKNNSGRQKQGLRRQSSSEWAIPPLGFVILISVARLVCAGIALTLAIPRCSFSSISEAVCHHGAVLHERQIQPTTAAAPPRGGAILVAHFLKHLPNSNLKTIRVLRVTASPLLNILLNMLLLCRSSLKSSLKRPADRASAHRAQSCDPPKLHRVALQTTLMVVRTVNAQCKQELNATHKSKNIGTRGKSHT